jgi:hypothetical protein
MRYDENLIKKIIAELERVPIIRQACTKFGINHSTFYRWMAKYPVFRKRVMSALILGRGKLNDTAESVIVKGIQEQNFKAAAFWLTHNNIRYMGLEKGKHYMMLARQMIDVLDSDPSEEPPDCLGFEKAFEIFRQTEEKSGVKIANKIMEPIIKLLCNEDAGLVDLFYSSYAEWKSTDTYFRDQAKKLGVEYPKEEEEELD